MACLRYFAQCSYDGPLKAAGIETIALDVTKAEEVASVRAQIAELTGGTLNMLINNAYVHPVANSSSDV